MHLHGALVSESFHNYYRCEALHIRAAAMKLRASNRLFKILFSYLEGGSDAGNEGDKGRACPKFAVHKRDQILRWSHYLQVISPRMHTNEHYECRHRRLVIVCTMQE